MLDVNLYLPHNQIQEMRTLSPVVDEYISRELFKEDFGAHDYAIGDILNSCYTIIYDELQVFGVAFSAELSEIISDRYTANNLLVLRRILQPEFISSCFSLDQNEEVDKLCTIVNNAEDPDQVLLSVVDYLYEISKNDILVNLGGFIINFVYSTPVFVDKFNIVLSNLTKKEISPEALAKVGTYLAKVSDHRRQVRTNIEYLLDHDFTLRSSVDSMYLKKYVDEYDNDKITADSITLYAHIDVEKVPVGSEELAKKYMDRHHARSVHHVEYWKAHPDQKVKLEDVMLMIAHVFEEHHHSEDHYKEEFSEVLELLGNTALRDDAIKMYDSLLAIATKEVQES